MALSRLHGRLGARPAAGPAAVVAPPVAAVYPARGPANCAPSCSTSGTAGPSPRPLAATGRQSAATRRRGVLARVVAVEQEAEGEGKTYENGVVAKVGQRDDGHALVPWMRGLVDLDLGASPRHPCNPSHLTPQVPVKNIRNFSIIAHIGALRGGELGGMAHPHTRPHVRVHVGPGLPACCTRGLPAAPCQPRTGPTAASGARSRAALRCLGAG
jgi:hypothetical protein